MLILIPSGLHRKNGKCHSVFLIYPIVFFLFSSVFWSCRVDRSHLSPMVVSPRSRVCWKFQNVTPHAIIFHVLADYMAKVTRTRDSVSFNRVKPLAVRELLYWGGGFDLQQLHPHPHPPRVLYNDTIIMHFSSHLISFHAISFNLILSYPISFHFISSRLVSSHLILHTVVSKNENLSFTVWAIWLSMKTFWRRAHLTNYNCWT